MDKQQNPKVQYENSRLSLLTQREREVLHWIGSDKTNAQIAVILSLSLRTVDKHTQNILRKLQVKSRVAATLHVTERTQTGT